MVRQLLLIAVVCAGSILCISFHRSASAEGLPDQTEEIVPETSSRAPGPVQDRPGRQDELSEGKMLPENDTLGDGEVPEISKGVPGDVHAREKREFWNSLGPGKWVTSVLENGYKLPLSRQLDSYREKNNKTARLDMEFIKQPSR